MIRTVLLACLLSLPSPIPGYRVLDQADVLSDAAQNQLETLSRGVDHATTAEIAVVTVNSLEGRSVEEYANQLFNEWGIGKRGVNNGVLILVAPHDRRIRIEVGYGLEPLLSDGLCGEIIAGEAIPAFKRGDFEGGIVAAASEIANVLNDHPDAARGVAGSAPKFVLTQGKISGFAVYGSGLFAIACVLLAAIFSSGRRFPTGIYAPIAASLLLIPAGALWHAWNRVSAIETGVVGSLSTFAFLFATRRFLRYGLHPCPKCKGSMTLLNEIEDDAHLETVQKLEEKLESVDYDVWVCPVCMTKDTETYIEWFSSFSRCPKCDRRTYDEVTRTLRQATTSSTGEALVTGNCASCGYKTSRRETIPMVVESSSSSGGSSGGGGGGGSFGGGSSGGGGASGSW